MSETRLAIISRWLKATTLHVGLCLTDAPTNRTTESKTLCYHSNNETVVLSKVYVASCCCCTMIKILVSL